MGPVLNDSDSVRENLLNSLRGQVVYIPNLSTLVQNWPNRINPHFDQLTKIVNTRLASLVSDPKKLAKLKDANFALFASTWWPYADLEKLSTVAYLAIWLFLWDDEIDQSTGTLNTDFEAAQAYREDTRKFVKYSLGFGHDEKRFQNLHPFIGSFLDISRPISACYIREQREMLLTEILFFIDMCEEEQQVRLNGSIPSPMEYWKYRLGTSATGICTAAIEYSHGMHLPDGLMQDPDMKIVWEQQNIIISISNDILSLKKELTLGCVDSLIPISCFCGFTIQEAIKDAVASLKTSIASFDAAANRVVRKWNSTDNVGNEDLSSSPAILSDGRGTQSNGGNVLRDIKAFIDGCRHICTGNIKWSLTTDRYALGNQPRDAHGGIELIL